MLTGIEWPTPAFAEPGPRRWLALALGAVCIALDLTVFVDEDLANGPLRLLVGLGVSASYLFLGGDARALGIRLRPVSGGRFWVKVFLIYGLVCIATIAVLGLFVWWRQLPVESFFRTEADVRRFAFGGCIHAPITEEVIYRLVLCAPLVSLIGRVPTMLTSACLFTVLHLAWGNFEPNHPVGGLLLAWAYLRSGCLWVPIFIHSLNNLFALGVYSYLFYSG